ncbi:MAG: hypothetical protein JXA18_17670, partial [Chitinispirillaceae bacterium]|nr:hypothetical protein [Chitinispirillaceae bacterium]
ASNSFRIRAAFPGSFSIVVITPVGRIVGRFKGRGPSLINCVLPGHGIYIVSLINDRNGRVIRSVLRVSR